jgi:hypothetical protein
MTWRTWALLICLAAAATYCTYLARNYPVPPSLQWPALLLDYIHLPAFLVSALVSGNFHDPPFLLRYGLVFVTYLLLLSFVAALLRRARNK